MNLKEVEKVVRKIQSHLFKNSNSYSIGMLKSHFRGSGIQFKEHQVYNPGDDVRFIDWKVSAKTSNTFIKTFEEERNIEITVVIDVCQSMFMGYKGISKLLASIELTCLLYLLAEETKDRIRVVIFTDKITTLPVLSGHEGIVTFIAFLERLFLLKESGKVNLEYYQKNYIEEDKKINLIKSYIARKKEVVFLTDFNSFENIEQLDKLMVYRNMHCFRITGPLDKTAKSAFTILSYKNQNTRLGKKLFNLKSSKDVEVKKGRWKELSVEERYLEDFIKEML